jgi:hypothetical protein
VAFTASRGPLLLNLGGDPLSGAIVGAASRRHVAFVQTNLDEHLAGHADWFAADIFASLAPESIAITLGCSALSARLP